jgi:hypothetical protein
MRVALVILRKSQLKMRQHCPKYKLYATLGDSHHSTFLVGAALDTNHAEKCSARGLLTIPAFGRLTTNFLAVAYGRTATIITRTATQFADRPAEQGRQRPPRLVPARYVLAISASAVRVRR